MTHEELVAIAREQVRDFKDPEGHCPSLQDVPKSRVVEAVVVYFESDEHDGTIEVVLQRDSGKLLGATLTPRKLKLKGAT